MNCGWICDTQNPIRSAVLCTPTISSLRVVYNCESRYFVSLDLGNRNYSAETYCCISDFNFLSCPSLLPPSYHGLAKAHSASEYQSIQKGFRELMMIHAISYPLSCLIFRPNIILICLPKTACFCKSNTLSILNISMIYNLEKALFQHIS